MENMERKKVKILIKILRIYFSSAIDRVNILSYITVLFNSAFCNKI